MPRVKPIGSRGEDAVLLSVTALIPLAFFFFDGPVTEAVRRFHEERPFGYGFVELLNPFMDFISHGATQIIVSLCLLAGGLLLRHRVQRVGWSLAVGFISSGLLAQVIKHLAGRARPRISGEPLFIGPTFQGGYDSFPSGHTTSTFCLACILSHYFPRYRVLFYLYACMTGLDRIEGLSHFPSDVLTGVVLGILVGRFVIQSVRYPWAYRYAPGEQGQHG